MIINQIGGGGSAAVVNAVLQACKANGADISANTFVEFVGAAPTWSAEQAVSSTTGSGKYLSAVKLTDNNVLFAYETGSSSSFTLYGHILTFSGGTVTVGAAQTLATYNASKPFCVIPMSSTQAVLYCGYGSQTYAQHMVLTISGSTITTSGAAPETSLIITYGIEGCKVTDTTFIVIWRNATSSHHWQINAYTFDGTTITYKATSAISTTAASNRNYAQRAFAVQMSDGVAVVVGAGASNYPTALVVTADSSDAFTFGTAVNLAAVTAGIFRVARITDTLAVALYGSGAADNTPVYAVPLTISGTTITVGAAVQVSSGSVTSYNTALTALKNGYALCAFGNEIAILEVTAVAVTAAYTGTTSYTAYTSGDHVACLIGDGALLAFGTATNANAIGYGSIDYLIEPSAEKINGLTKALCTSATAGNVWVLDL